MSKEIEVGSLEEAQAQMAQLNADASVNKPTEKEINAAVDEFNTKAEEFNKRMFAIGDGPKAPEVYTFVLDFLQHHVYWTKNGWMGVLKMFDELKETFKTRKEDDPFVLGYHALEFLFYALTNPGGTGIETARAIEKVADIYIEVMEIAGKVLEDAREDLKDIQWLQDKVSAMQQGFYLEKEDGVEGPTQEEFENFAAPSVDDLLNKE